jgi:hypothetical protein
MYGRARLRVPNVNPSPSEKRMSTKYELKNLATGKTSQLNAITGTIGPEALDISNLTKEQGVFTFDPGFMATASTESKITYIDGDAGMLLYRGYPVEQLAEKSSFLEVANLLINGTLPTKTELCAFQNSIMRHTMVNEQLLRFFQGFHHDAHPMAMVSAVVASMAAFYHDTTDIEDPRHREIFAHRIIAKLPTIAAAAYKHTLGQPFIYPRNDLRYCANMLNMFFAVPCEPYSIDPVAAEASICCSSCTRITSRTPAPRRCGWPAAPARIPMPRFQRACPRFGGPRTAAPMKPCSTCWTESARPPTSTSSGAGQGQERSRALDGIRPSCLQELRSARQDHPRHVLPRAGEARQDQ